MDPTNKTRDLIGSKVRTFKEPLVLKEEVKDEEEPVLKNITEEDIDEETSEIEEESEEEESEEEESGKKPAIYEESDVEDEEKEEEKDEDEKEESPAEDILQMREEITATKQYPFEDTLDMDYSKITSETEKPKKVYVIVYTIVNFNDTPFLKFMLYKYESKYRDKCTLAFFNYKDGIDIEAQSIKYITGYSSIKTKDAFEHKGYRKYEDNIYVFFKTDTVEQEGIYKPRDAKNNMWWTLVCEIVNYKKLLNFPIDPIVINFFNNNPDVMYLYGDDGNLVSTPNVGYHGTYYKYVRNIIEDGLKESETGMLGPCYYFGTFRKAVRYAGWTSDYEYRTLDGSYITTDKGKYILSQADIDSGAKSSGGILRYVMFTKNMKVLLNHPAESYDYSEKIRLLDMEGKVDRWERNTMKLHDHDAKWKRDYDSIYVGRVTLPETKGVFLTNPEFGIKSDTQFMLLTSHLLDERTLARENAVFKWEPEKTSYQIL